jgi:hypothetical protein
MRRASGLRVPFHLDRVDLGSYLTLRLTEHTLHNWDVRVAFDPGATLAAPALPLLIAVLLSGVAQVSDRQTADRLAPAELVISTVEPDGRYLLTIDEGVSLRLLEEGQAAPSRATGLLELPTEALMRLVSGRLDPEHTPDRAVAAGRPTLDDLRLLFPVTSSSDRVEAGTTGSDGQGRPEHRKIMCGLGADCASQTPDGTPSTSTTGGGYRRWPLRPLHDLRELPNP